jgi:hypothetical protein
MRKLLRGVLSIAIAACGISGADFRTANDASAAVYSGSYYWKSVPVDGSAQLLTLFCKSCAMGADTPLLAVLRDTLGDSDAENDRLTYVWLLNYSPLNWHQRTLAAVPFFYWRLGKGSREPANGTVRPLLNLGAPLHPVLNEINQSLLQWSLFDPMTTAVRASSRAYRENSADHERLHLEQAISYLAEAPSAGVAGSGVAVKQSDINLLMARLSLRKRLLGGLVANDRAGAVGERERVEQERVRMRNWELLRQSAEKTGLIFEPMTLSGEREEYAMLWYPVKANDAPVYHAEVGPLWKILNIQDPWKDDKIKNWHGITETRELGPNGEPIQLIPLAAYSLNYPRMPLLMVDFRGGGRVRRRELTQRSINQLVNGVIGVSHFANWYYFVGADVYSFVATRHGSAQNMAARLDCYSQFRAELALDTQLPSELREEMQRRLDALAVNPLDAQPAHEIEMAKVRYDKLQSEATDGGLTKLLDLERRAEVANFGSSRGHLAFDAFLHAASFSLYTHRAGRKTEVLETLDRNRRVEANLSYLGQVVQSGTQPEVAYDGARIDAAVNELSALLPGVRSGRIRTEAIQDLKRVQELTADEHLRADCAFALRASNQAGGPALAAQPRAIGKAASAALESVP